MSAARARQLVATCALLIAASSCAARSNIGNACPNGRCDQALHCEQAEQEYPDGCDKSRSTCHNADVPPDQMACEMCGESLTRLNIQDDVTPCACRHCAVQLRACFESAEYEPDGDPDRDDACRKIVECGWANDCAGGDCYCGDGVDRVTCLQNGNAGKPLGKCARLIEQLVTCEEGMELGNCVFTIQQTPDTVLARATDLALCVTGDPLLLSSQVEPQCPLPPKE